MERDQAMWQPIVVAIPARDEEACIGTCLAALDAQIGAAADHVVLFVNDSKDATAARARAIGLRAPTQLHVHERILPPALANAGHARRIAMDLAFTLGGPGAILMTSDADAQVDPDWIAANLAAVRAGADAVAGWVELDPRDWGSLPMQLHEDDARECAYDALCDEITALLDPDPADPWPRHTQNSGASIALTASAYAQCGGVPPVASGEDRALIAALRAIDAKVRHAPEVHAYVSGRIEGRAAGGMADTIRRRLTEADDFLDDRLEPAAACGRRAWLRRLLRAGWHNSDMIAGLARRLGLPAELLADMLARPRFGAAWSAIEEASPVLRRVPVAVSDLSRQMKVAQALLQRLRAAPVRTRVTGSATPAAFAASGDIHKKGTSQ